MKNSYFKGTTVRLAISYPDRSVLADMHPGTLKEVIRIIDLSNQRGAHVYDTSTWEVKRIQLSSI